MPVNYVTTNANEYTWTATNIPPGEYTFSNITEWTYDDRNFRLTPEALDELIDRINRVSPINNYSFCDELETAVTYQTVKPQEEEEFDTTEIEKYIDSLEKEVVGTEN